MSILEKVRHHGVVGSAKKVITKFQQKSGYFYWKYRHAPIYANPTADELMQIESDLSALGVKVQDYTPPAGIHGIQARTMVSVELSRRYRHRCMG